MRVDMTSKRGGEIIVALFLIFGSILGWIETTNFEVEPGMVKTLGPAFFPQMLFAGIILLSIALILQALFTASATETISWGYWYKVPLAASVMLFQALTYEELSTFVAVGISLPLLLWIAGVKPWNILVVTVSFLIFIYLFFILLLRVPLPLQFLPTVLT